MIPAIEEQKSRFLRKIQELENIGITGEAIAKFLGITSMHLRYIKREEQSIKVYLNYNVKLDEFADTILDSANKIKKI